MEGMYRIDSVDTRNVCPEEREVVSVLIAANTMVYSLRST